MIKDNLMFAIVCGAIVVPLIVLAALLPRPERGRIHNGKCDVEGCDRDGMIFLDGKEIMCWEHYSERMAELRSRDPGPRA